jgi:RNA polymerase sigma factor (sigma-70 family)
VNESERGALQALWHELAKRNQWSLVDDEAAFIDQALTELHQLTGDNLPKRMVLALRRTYSAILYRGFQSDQEAAIEELRRTLIRLVFHKVNDDLATAEDLAQETLAAIVKHFSQVDSPQGFLGWAIITLFRLVAKAAKHAAVPVAYLSQSAELNDLIDVQNMTTEVERNILSATVVALLRTMLPNELERIVLERVILYEEKPSDIARDLGLPLHRTRVAKHRGFQRLCSDEKALALLQDLTGTAGVQLSATGDQDDEV